MKYLNIYALILTVIILVSCEDYLTKEIPFEDVGFEELLVINSTINSETEILEVSISKNINFADATRAEYQFVNGAAIKLTVAGTDVYEAKPMPSPIMGIYNYFIDLGEIDIVNKTLKLEATHPDYPTATSETIIPKPATFIDQTFEVDATTKVIFGYTEVYDKLTATFQDDPDSENYYSFKILQVGTPDTLIFDEDGDGDLDTLIYTNTFFASMESDDINAEYVGDYPNELLFSDKNFNGQEYSFELLAQIWGQTDSLVLSYESISESDFYFRQSYINYLNAQDFGFFSEPVTLYSNIENGLGVFRAFDKEEIPIIR